MFCSSLEQWDTPRKAETLCSQFHQRESYGPRLIEENSQKLLPLTNAAFGVG